MTNLILYILYSQISILTFGRYNMTDNEITFGMEISRLRKKLNMSQKELASLVLKDDQTPITPQYLNDIEHDRRNPSSDDLIKAFSRALQLSSDEEDYLFYIAGKMPKDVRAKSRDEFYSAIAAFRKSNT